MRIDHVTFSKVGGAGRVAKLLSDQLNRVGHDSKLIFFLPEGLRQTPFSHPLLSAGALVDSLAVTNHSASTLFSLIRSKIELLDTNRLRKGAVAHFHWIEGVAHHATILELLRSGRPVVWTLHDMAPFTGGCHHVHSCHEFRYGCHGCPQTRQIFRNQVSNSHVSKNLFGERWGNLRIVAPTRWMADKAAGSSILGKQIIEVVSNPVDPTFFELSLSAQRSLITGTADLSTFRFVVVANDLSDPNKRVREIISAVSSTQPRVRREMSITLVGGSGDKFTQLPNVKSVGNLDSESLAMEILGCDVLISASSAESFGLSVAESGVLGVPSIVIGRHGASELVSHGINGWFGESMDDLPALIELAASLSAEERQCISHRSRDFAQRTYSSGAVVSKYSSIYESVSSRNSQ